MVEDKIILCIVKIQHLSTRCPKHTYLERCDSRKVDIGMGTINNYPEHCDCCAEQILIIILLTHIWKILCMITVFNVVTKCGCDRIESCLKNIKAVVQYYLMSCAKRGYNKTVIKIRL